MDKFFKNNASGSSNENSIIDKFRTELSKEFEEGFRNTRKLTIESPNIANTRQSAHDIDSKINDLENLIKRLQDEIVDMTNEVDKPLDDKVYSIPGSHEKIDNKETKSTSSKTKSHIYQVAVKDNILYGQSKDKEEQLDPARFSSTEELSDAFTAIRQQFSLLWNDDDQEICSGPRSATASSILADIHDDVKEYKD